MFKKLFKAVILSAAVLVSFCNPVKADDIDPYVKLLLHMDGSDTSTTFTDSEIAPVKTVNVVTAEITTSQSVFGGASGNYTGTKYNYLSYSSDWDMGTGDFTIDFRVRYTDIASGHRVVFAVGSYATNGLIFQRNTDGLLYYAQSGTLKSVAWTPSLDTWYHIAIVRQGRYTSIYVDGTLLVTHDFTTTQNLNVGSGNFSLGWEGTSNYLNGYIDEFRVSKGIARWTANFTPPTSAYSDTTSDSTVTSSARQFTAATTEYFSSTWNSGLSYTGDFTISAWVRADSFANTFRTIAASASSDGNHYEWILYQDVAASRFKFYLAHNGTSASSMVATADNLGAPSTATWYFVVGHWDATAHTATISVNDGTVNTTTNLAITPSNATSATFTVSSFNANQFTWDGRIGPIGFWKRKLTTGEITSIYNAGSGKLYKDLTTGEKTTLEGWWDGTETSGQLIDASGNSHNLTDNNTVTSASGKVTYTANDSSQFTAASSEYFSRANASLTNLNPGDVDFYGCGWFKFDSFVTLNSLLSIWKDNGTGGTCAYLLDYLNSTSKFRWSVTSSGSYNSGVTTLNATTFGAASLNTWYFLEWYHDSVNNVLGICINRGTTDTTAHSTGVYVASTTTFRIGALESNYYNSGQEANIVWTLGIPTTAERNSLYNRGFGVDYTDRPTLSTATYVSWWPMTESSGTRYDVIGTNNLTDNNTVTSANGLIYNAPAAAVATRRKSVIFM